MRKIILLLLITSQGFSQTNFNSKFWAKIPEGKVFLGNTVFRLECKQAGKLSSEHPACLDLKEVSEFYISKFEVSTSDYLNFLNDQAERNRHSPKSKVFKFHNGWGSEFVFDVNDFFKRNNDETFPVVEITFESANEYCKWLQEKLKQSLKRDLVIRLPTEEEWVRAAVGDSYFNSYTWESFFLTDNKGAFQCNFMPFDERYSKYDYNSSVYTKIHFSHVLDGYISLAPCKSHYKPNRFGLHNMLGNVSEMILEKEKAKGGNWGSVGSEVNVSSVQLFTDTSPYVGFRPVLIFK